MALINALDTPTGAIARYWRIIQINQHADRLDLVVELAGYLDTAARRAGKSALTSVQFNFAPADHPLSELDPDVIDPALLADWRNWDYHLIYRHIHAVAAVAENKADELTANEHVALQFAGAEDLI